MRKLYWLILAAAYQWAAAQSVQQKLENDIHQWESIPAFKHASVAISVLQSRDGTSVYAYHGQMGLAPASCQKLFTSVAAFELLGPSYSYVTSLDHDGHITDGVLYGNLYLTGTGDPTLGSWRFDSTKESVLFADWIAALRNAGIVKISGTLIPRENHWDTQTIPGGWVWEDIGNYYGAGASPLNWRENQYDLVMEPGKKIGDSARLVTTIPKLVYPGLVNEVLTAEPNSGDQTRIYWPPLALTGEIQGTIPIDKNRFVVSGAFANSSAQLLFSLSDTLRAAGYSVPWVDGWYSSATTAGSSSGALQNILSHRSPPLDSMNYWFLKKSINLFGEAFVKTIGLEKKGIASTAAGVEILRNFWIARGIDGGSIHIQDGSGLSPQNRVTTDALVSVLRYAQSRPWFPSFYNALPQINGMKMKSGSIGGVKSYAGYQQSKTGNLYLFAVIVNNYDGPSDVVIKKIWQLLDLLK